MAASHVTWAAPSLPLPTTVPGASGTAAGFTAPDAADGVLVPRPLVAVTWKLYVVPLLRPCT